MRLAFVFDAVLALILSVVVAYAAALFVVEDPFPGTGGKTAMAQVMEKTARDIYGSDNAVIGEAHYLSIQYPVHDGGVERIQVSVRKARYDIAQEGEMFELRYNPENTEQVRFAGKKDPLSLPVWWLILTVCCFPVAMMIILRLRGGRKVQAD